MGKIKKHSCWSESHQLFFLDYTANFLLSVRHISAMSGSTKYGLKLEKQKEKKTSFFDIWTSVCLND